ncbi:hypothetical protein WS63_05155 [Burkholderia stagnalis]|nr:hypothetical protein WS63_05155 [Burkholderia stagnalis]
MLRLRLEGLTLEAIGERMGVRADTVHGIISRALAAMTREPAEELLALELARCDALLLEAMRVMKTFHPMLHSGAEVRVPVEDEVGQLVVDQETGRQRTRVLEDHVPVLAAINTAIRVMERRAKLLGIDRPTKVAATDPAGHAAVSPVLFYLPSNGRDPVDTTSKEWS